VCGNLEHPLTPSTLHGKGLDRLSEEDGTLHWHILQVICLKPTLRRFLLQIAKLKAQSDANKEINDRKRLATSYANFESSRSPTSPFHPFWVWTPGKAHTGVDADGESGPD